MFYFLGLWKGDPPVKQGYSESAHKLKNAFIELTKRKQTCQCSLENLNFHIKNLWFAVLEENFVFSFKNTLEVSAYSELDTQFGQ